MLKITMEGLPNSGKAIFAELVAREGSRTGYTVKVFEEGFLYYQKAAEPIQRSTDFAGGTEIEIYCVTKDIKGGVS